MTPEDSSQRLESDTPLTVEKIRRAYLAVLEAGAADHEDFWARTMATHGVR
jgi:hypothetical protein